MSMENIVELLKETLEKKTGKEVIVNKTIKNNGLTLTGITIRDDNTNMTPVIYVNEYINNLEDYESIDNIADIIIERNNSYKVDKSVDFSWFSDFNKVKDKLMFKLVNYSENEEMLKGMPYTRFLDLAKVYYAKVKLDDSAGTVNILNKHLEVWGVSTEELDKIADENTPKELPARVDDISNVIRRMAVRMGYDDKYIEEVLEVQQKEQSKSMYVMSNPEKTYGAAVLCYQDAIKRFAEEKDTDLAIIPSSVHELILVTDVSADTIIQLKIMVKEVNETELSKDEFLSNSIYVYCRKADRIVNI